MDKFEKAVLGLLSAFGVIIFSSFVYMGGSIPDSIFPELVGFSLEGVVLVVLFSWYQRMQRREYEAARKRALKLSLRSQLFIFFQWALPLDTNLDTIPQWEDPGVLKQLYAELHEKRKLTDVQPMFLRDFANHELPLLQSMLPVAASIGPNCMRKWALIINNLKGIANSETDEGCFHALVDFLEAVKQFDAIESVGGG